MPIVDISGLSQNEAEPKARIREKIQKLFASRLEIDVSSTVVTFITDETAGSGTHVHVLARMYSIRFLDLRKSQLKKLSDDVVRILEKEARHEFHEAFPIPVMAMRGGTVPYKPQD